MAAAYSTEISHRFKCCRPAWRFLCGGKLVMSLTQLMAIPGQRFVNDHAKIFRFVIFTSEWP